MTSDCTDMGIRTLEFMAETQFILFEFKDNIFITKVLVCQYRVYSSVSTKSSDHWMKKPLTHLFRQMFKGTVLVIEIVLPFNKENT